MILLLLTTSASTCSEKLSQPGDYFFSPALYSKNNPSCFSRYGSHWERIGFQGTDPSTDLRGVGLLGLVQPLFLLATPDTLPFAIDVYRISQSEAQASLFDQSTWFTG